MKRFLNRVLNCDRRIIFLLTASIVTLNFLTDVILAIVDPRIRRG